MKTENEVLFANPFSEDSLGDITSVEASTMVDFSREIIDATLQAKEMISNNSILSEEEAIDRAINSKTQVDSVLDVARRRARRQNEERDLIISIRAAFTGFVFSLIDSTPAEICLISLKNVNTLATWNKLRTSTSTLYVTVAILQVDNMVPNAPFPVAVAPSEQMTESAIPERRGGDQSTKERSPPLLVIGVALAPRHESGIIVSNRIWVHFGMRNVP
jgi:hypothetical protein